jgi:hypothetical protein
LVADTAAGEGVPSGDKDLTWQLIPEYPATHAHVWELTPSEHLAPFLHGLEAQSSILISQLVPEYPATHAHVWELTPSEHLAPFLHGLEAHGVAVAATTSYTPSAVSHVTLPPP